MACVRTPGLLIAVAVLMLLGSGCTSIHSVNSGAADGSFYLVGQKSFFGLNGRPYVLSCHGNGESVQCVKVITGKEVGKMAPQSVTHRSFTLGSESQARAEEETFEAPERRYVPVPRSDADLLQESSQPARREPATRATSAAPSSGDEFTDDSPAPIRAASFELAEALRKKLRLATPSDSTRTADAEAVNLLLDRGLSDADIGRRAIANIREHPSGTALHVLLRGDSLEDVDFD